MPQAVPFGCRDRRRYRIDAPPLTPLDAFRQGAYACFSRAADALFEVGDALLTEDRARSFVELSQAPGLQRQWPSVYAALRDGQIDRDALRRLMVGRLPGPVPGDRLGLGVDPSPIHRPEAPTAADRTLVYSPNLPAGTTPVRPGWSFSTMAVLPDPPSSWTYVLDNERVPSTATATTVGARQLAALLPRLAARPLLLGDGHDGSAPWGAATGGLPCAQLLRTTRDRVLDRPAPPRTGKRGAPKKDGLRFKGSTPSTHGTPDATWGGVDATSQPLTVTCWTGLHLKSCRDVPIAVLPCCGSPGRGRPGPRVTPASHGCGGWAGRCPRWRRCRRSTPGASVWSTATGSTNRRYGGRRRACGPRSGSNVGPIGWRSATIRWSWPAPGPPSPIARGRRRPAQSPHPRCGGRCRGLWRRSARRPAHRNHAENRRGGRRGP